MTWNTNRKRGKPKETRIDTSTTTYVVPRLCFKGKSNRYIDIIIDISKYTFLIISYKTNKVRHFRIFNIKYPISLPFPNNALFHHALTLL